MCVRYWECYEFTCSVVKRYDRTCLVPCQGVHECGDYISWLLGIGMGVVVDASGVALYPCNRVADDCLEKLAVVGPLFAVDHLRNWA